MLTLKIGLFSYRQLKRGEILAVMLYGAGFLSLLNGQFGQPTNLGFSVFICGLCLAAGNTKAPIESPLPENAALPRVARRSRYAERIHTLPAARHQPDDFVDR
jgi:hypothetical protein